MSESSKSPKAVKLNSQVYVFEPPGNAGSKLRSSDPAVIIAFSWIDAQLSYSRKYTNQLRKIFPTSTIVLVMITAGFYFSLEKSREAILSPVLGILHRERDNGYISKGILLFIMSNGGGFQFMTLRKLLSKTRSGPVNPSQNPIAVIYDSTPGDNPFESAILSNAPNNPFLRPLIIPLITLTYGALYTFDFLSGKRPLLKDLRSAYLQTNILPSISNTTNVKAAPRLYIYSKKDKVTLSKYVESHIKEANLMGLDVTVEEFQDTPHVAHARQDPDRYWGAVRKVWLRATQQAQSRL